VVSLEELLPQSQALLQAVFGSKIPAIQETLYSQGTKKLVLQLQARGAAPLRELRPDIKAMMAAHDGSVFKGITVCTLGEGGEVDFHSRYFAPWNGIDEEPCRTCIAGPW
jgi:predicted PhzF superfamily epimerase YddE/YHI9